MSDRLDGLEGGLSDAASELSMWRSLKEHPGWQKLVKDMKVEESMRALVVTRKPIGHVGEAFRQEYMKGEANGLGLALAHPDTEIEALSIEIRKLEVEIRNEKELVGRIARDEADAGGRVPSDDGSLGSAG